MPALLVKINVDDKGNVAIEKLSKSAKQAQPKVKSLGDTMKNAFAVIGLYKGINFLITSLERATQESLKFQKAMQKVKAIGNESGDTMRFLGAEIDKLALNIEHSYTQIAEAQLGITKAGIRGAEGVNVLRHALDLATVSGEEQQAVSEGLINILNAFNLGTEKAGYAAHVMSNALNETILNLEEYLDAMKYSAPVAAQLGISFERLSTMVGILAQTGQRGSLAGTGLRNVFLNILKVTPAVAESLKDVKVETLGVVELLELLNKNGLPTIDLLQQFNKRGLLAAVALGKNAEKVYDLQKRLMDLSRPLSEVADEVRDNLLDQLKMLNNHFIMIFNTLNEYMGEGGASVLDNFMLKLLDFNRTLKENPQVLKNWTTALVNLGNVLVNLVPVMGFIVKHSKALIIAWAGSTLVIKITEVATALKTLKKLSIFTFNPMILSITALTGVVTTLGIKLSKTNKDLKEFKSSVDKFGTGIATVKTLTDVTKEKAQHLLNVYKSFLNVASETEKKALMGLLDKSKWGSVSKYVIKDIVNIYKLEDALAKEANITFDKNFQKRIEQITALTGAMKLYGDETEKASKKFGANMTLPGGDISGWDKTVEYIQSLGITAKNVSARMFDTLSGLIEQSKFGSGDIGILQRLQAQIVDKLYPRNKEFHKSFAEDNLQNFKELTKSFKEIQKEDPFAILQGVDKFMDKYRIFYDTSNSVTDMISSRRDFEHQKQMQIYDKEMTKLTQRYNLEKKAAGDSALQRSLAENSYQAEKERLDKRANAEKRKYAQKQWKADRYSIFLNGAIITSNFIANLSKVMSPYIAIPVGTALASTITGLQLGVAAKNNPAQALWQGGRVEGTGNSTSDSNRVRLSKGEWVFSREDVERLGGDSVIQRMITMGDNVSNYSPNVYFGTIIGEENYIRKNIIPFIREEVRR